jgi:hypothetical protein
MDIESGPVERRNHQAGMRSRTGSGARFTHFTVLSQAEVRLRWRVFNGGDIPLARWKVLELATNFLRAAQFVR